MKDLRTAVLYCAFVTLVMALVIHKMRVDQDKETAQRMSNYKILDEPEKE